MAPDFNLQPIINGDHAQLERLFLATASTQADALRLNTAEKIWQFLIKGDQCDAQLVDALTTIQQPLMTHLAQHPEFYCDAKDPLRLALEFFSARARTWYWRDSKISQQTFEKLRDFIHAIGQYLENQNPLKLLHAINGLTQWCEAEDKRAQLLESRLCESEISQQKINAAETRVIDLLNTALANKHFAIDAANGIAGALKSELMHSYLNSGADNDFIKLWQKILPHLAMTFAKVSHEHTSEDDQQQLYGKIPSLLNEIERSIELRPNASDFYLRWSEGLRENLMTIIQKQTIACELIKAIPYPEGHLPSSTKVTADILLEIDSIQNGDWFLFQGEASHFIRCKLALKQVEAGQLLFVDNAGRKVMSKNFAEFSACLSTGIAKKITAVTLSDAITKLIQALLDLHKQREAQFIAQLEAKKLKALAEAEHQKLEQEQQRLAQEQQRLAEEAKRLAEEKKELERLAAIEQAARQAAAEKARAEAKALAEEKQRRERELRQQEEQRRRYEEQERQRQEEETQRRAREQALAEAQAREYEHAKLAAEHMQRFQLASMKVSALNLGARIEITQDDKKLSCKLAVIIAATGKYIFTDNIGRKVAELQRDQLVQGFLDQSIHLLNTGDSFDDQLAKVIRTLRKDAT